MFVGDFYSILDINSNTFIWLFNRFNVFIFHWKTDKYFLPNFLIFVPPLQPRGFPLRILRRLGGLWTPLNFTVDKLISMWAMEFVSLPVREWLTASWFVGNHPIFEKVFIFSVLLLCTDFPKMSRCGVSGSTVCVVKDGRHQRVRSCVPSILKMLVLIVLGRQSACEKGLCRLFSTSHHIWYRRHLNHVPLVQHVQLVNRLVCFLFSLLFFVSVMQGIICLSDCVSS